MKRILILTFFLFTPAFAQAKCYESDISKYDDAFDFKKHENDTSVQSFAIEVILKLDYSACSTEELLLTKKLMLQSASYSPADVLSGKDPLGVGISLGVAKGTLALVNAELDKRRAQADAAALAAAANRSGDAIDGLEKIIIDAR